METNQDIFDNTCIEIEKHTSIDIRKCRGKRDRRFVHMRMSIANIMMANTKIGVLELSKLLMLDHTTVIYYREQHRDRVKYDEQYYQTFINLSKIVSHIYALKVDTDLVTLLGVMRQTLTFK